MDGSRDGDLRCPSQLLEDAGHLAPAIRDAEFLPEDVGDPITGPDFAREAIRLGAVPEEVGDQADLLGSEFGTGTRARVSEEGIAPTGSRGGQPLADGALGDAQSGRDVALLPALVLEVQGLHTPPLPPVVRSWAWSLHTRIVRARSLVFHATLSNIFATGNVYEDTFANVTVNGASYSSANSSLAANVLLETLGDYSQNSLGSVNFFGTIFAPDGDVTIGRFFEPDRSIHRRRPGHCRHRIQPELRRPGGPRAG